MRGVVLTAGLTLLLSGMWVHAQTVAVTGTVSTSGSAVRYASVRFEETGNPSNAFTALTDSSGHYELSIVLTSVDPGPLLPEAFALGPNYPNPFSSSTSIPYELKTHSEVQVTVYDVLGQVVRGLVAGTQPGGTHEVLWDGRNNMGRKVANGIYLFSLRAGGKSQTRKMLMSAGAGGYATGPIRVSLAGAPAGLQVNHGRLGSSYTVKLENAATTAPLVVPRQVENVSISGDTTLDFILDRQVHIAVSTVELDSIEQLIIGFGGANILPWRPDMTGDQTQKAFGSGPGQLGFTILRLRIPYTDNENEFSAQVPTAKLAQSLGAIVIASPWTPPPAMKSNNNIVGGVLNEGSYGAYAAHLKAFADYMAAQGAPLYAVSLQNEPDASVTYESCSWNGTQLLNFTRDHAPAIGVRIMMPESQNFYRPLSDPTLNDSAAAAHVAIIAGHIYGGGLNPYPLVGQKAKEFWMTEHLDLDTSWAGVLGTGLEIHNCILAGMQAYVWWYTVRFYGPISEDGNVSKRGYVMSQYARFVRPGYHRIKSHPTPQRNVFVSAYRDSSSSRVVVVALNTGSLPLEQMFSLSGGSMTYFLSYTTSQSRNCAQGSSFAVMNGSFVATLDSSSITTFVSE